MSKQNIDPKNDPIISKENQATNEGEKSNMHIPTKSVALIALLILLIKWIMDKIFGKDKEKQPALALNGNNLEISPKNENNKTPYQPVTIINLLPFLKNNRKNLEKLNSLVETNQTSLKSTYGLATKPNHLFQLSELVLTLKQNNTNANQIEKEIEKYEKTQGKLPDGFKNDLTTYIKNENNLKNPDSFKNLDKLGEQVKKFETIFRSGLITPKQTNSAQQTNSLEVKEGNAIQPNVMRNQPTPQQQAVLHHVVQTNAQQNTPMPTPQKESGNQEWMKAGGCALATAAAVANGPGK